VVTFLPRGHRAASDWADNDPMSFNQRVGSAVHLNVQSVPRIRAVHTVVPGRARLKIAGLRRSPMLKRTIEALPPRVSCLQRVQASTLTGNVLVFYDGSVSPGELIEFLAGALADALAAAPAMEGVAKPRPTCHRGFADPERPPAAVKLGNGLSLAALTKLSTWHTRPTDDVLTSLQSSAQGLEIEEVAARLLRFGPNRLPKAQRASALRLFLGQFVSPPIALLGASAAVAVATGGLLDAAAILGVVIINAIIGFVTEYQTQRIIAALGKAPAQLVVTLRGGLRHETGVEDIVAGDILLLAPGTRIPADARLLEATRLSIDESGLTGESMPVV
jgi:Ca2+-transporting ATPase